MGKMKIRMDAVIGRVVADPGRVQPWIPQTEPGLCILKGVGQPGVLIVVSAGGRDNAHQQNAGRAA